MKLSKRIRLTVTKEDNTSRVMEVMATNYIFSAKQEENNIIKRKELTTDLKFTKEDFNWVYAIELDAVERCKKLFFKLEDVSKTSNTITVHMGYVSMNDGDWNVDDCEVSFDIRIEDEYTCIEDKLKVQINILEGLSTNSIRYHYQDATIETQNRGTIDPIPPLTEGWVLTMSSDTKFDGTDFYVINNHVYSRFVKTFAVAPPDTLGWVQIGATTQYFKQPHVRLKETVFNTFALSVERVVTYDIIEEIEEGEILDNGVRLESVLNKLFEDCGLTIVSNWFNINPDSSNPVNDAYNFAADYMRNVFCFQKSDIKRPNDSQNATILNITIEDVQKHFSQMQQVYFIIDGDKLRVEHISYFEDVGVNIEIDLTTLKDGVFIEKKHKYTYNQADNPINETFEYMEETSFFRSGLIEYDPVCASKDKEPNEIVISDVQNDFMGVLHNDIEAISDKGIMYVSTVSYEGENVITSINFEPPTPIGVPILQITNIVNGAFSWDGLLKFCYAHDRYQPEGVVNGFDTTFTTTKRNKKQTPIEVDRFTSQEWEDLDINGLFITQLGQGKIDDIEYDILNARLTLNLLHR